MRALLLTACAAALAPCAWAGDESYTITIKRFPDVGKTFTARGTAKGAVTTKLTDADGNVLNDEKHQAVNQDEYTETTIEAGDRAPKKFKRFYHKARIDRGKGAVAEPHEGKAIVYELKDGKYQARVEGKDELPVQGLDGLAKQADDRLQEAFDTLVLPGKAVKVGQKWAIPGKKLATLPIPGLDAARSKGEGKLLKAYRKGGRQWGTLHLKATLVLSKLGKFELSPPGSMVMEGTLDTPIDGPSTASRLNVTVVVAGKTKVEGGAPQRTIDVKMQLELEAEHGEER
jgi:hypothetical protein